MNDVYWDPREVVAALAVVAGRAVYAEAAMEAHEGPVRAEDLLTGIIISMDGLRGAWNSMKEDRVALYSLGNDVEWAMQYILKVEEEWKAYAP